MLHLANVGQNIWIGNREACQTAPQGKFARTLHIGLKSMPEHQCGKFTPDDAGGLDMSLEYLDGTSLEHILATNGSRLALFFSGAEPVLIHCFAGTYRSPTLAVLAKGLRGCDPFDALGQIARATRSRYGLLPHFHDVPIAEIVRFLGY